MEQAHKVPEITCMVRYLNIHQLCQHTSILLSNTKQTDDNSEMICCSMYLAGLLDLHVELLVGVLACMLVDISGHGLLMVVLDGLRRKVLVTLCYCS